MAKMRDVRIACCGCEDEDLQDQGCEMDQPTTVIWMTDNSLEEGCEDTYI
jgi:hypothetical protein